VFLATQAVQSYTQLYEAGVCIAFLHAIRNILQDELKEVVLVAAQRQQQLLQQPKQTRLPRLNNTNVLLRVQHLTAALIALHGFVCVNRQRADFVSQFSELYR
jgi:hypothetical protein